MFLRNPLFSLFSPLFCWVFFCVCCFVCLFFPTAVTLFRYPHWNINSDFYSLENPTASRHITICEFRPFLPARITWHLENIATKRSPWCTKIYLEIFDILYSPYQILSPLPFFKYEFTTNEDCSADRPMKCSASQKKKPQNPQKAHRQANRWEFLPSALLSVLILSCKGITPQEEEGAQGLKPTEFFISFVQLDCHFTSVLGAGGWGGIQELQVTQMFPVSFKRSHSTPRMHAFLCLQHSAWAQIVIWSFRRTCPFCTRLWGFGRTGAGFFWDYSSVQNIWWSSPLHANLPEIIE